MRTAGSEGLRSSIDRQWRSYTIFRWRPSESLQPCGSPPKGIRARAESVNAAPPRDPRSTTVPVRAPARYGLLNNIIFHCCAACTGIPRFRSSKRPGEAFPHPPNRTGGMTPAGRSPLTSGHAISSARKGKAVIAHFSGRKRFDWVSDGVGPQKPGANGG